MHQKSMGNFNCLSPKEAQVITLSGRERMKNTERYTRKERNEMRH